MTETSQFAIDFYPIYGMTQRILVTEEIADSGLNRLRLAGFEVDVQLGISGKQFHDVLPGASALIVRSAT